MTDESFALCREITKRSGSNFARCFCLLSEEKRLGMEALYAFMRVTDDWADSEGTTASDNLAALKKEECADASFRQKLLTDWQNRVENALSGAAEDSPPPPALAANAALASNVRLLPALRETVQRFKIDPADILAAVEGCREDCTPAVRFETEADSFAYCDKVATSVGRATLAILGLKKPWSGALENGALGCGRAFQWTNFLRDAREDAFRGRLYFPMSDFARVRLDPIDFLALFTRYPPERALCRFRLADRRDPLTQFLTRQFERTDALYRQSEPLFAALPNDSARFLRLMIRVYRTIFEKIKKKPEAIFEKRVRLSFWDKLRVILAKKPEIGNHRFTQIEDTDRHG